MDDGFLIDSLLAFWIDFVLHRLDEGHFFVFLMSFVFIHLMKTISLGLATSFGLHPPDEDHFFWFLYEFWPSSI
ncbi:hypothetical protein ABE288_01445 [Bacillus salipaludis]|uniref:hypothetical protein n=1 Tax=Bacillus salipaludis TaxID=2547811 RepID=UPI003D1B4157